MNEELAQKLIIRRKKFDTDFNELNLNQPDDFVESLELLKDEYDKDLNDLGSSIEKVEDDIRRVYPPYCDGCGRCCRDKENPDLPCRFLLDKPDGSKVCTKVSLAGDNREDLCKTFWCPRAIQFNYPEELKDV